MENPTAVKGQLMQLRVMGVKIALDDFGTGQSSLAYLHQFPADKLKLDRSFVCDMETRNDVRDIVGTITTLAHQLGLEVIAEGVETGGQLAQVRSLGCEYVQGYFFSKPVDRERAAELLRTGFPPCRAASARRRRRLARHSRRTTRRPNAPAFGPGCPGCSTCPRRQYSCWRWPASWPASPPTPPPGRALVARRPGERGSLLRRPPSCPLRRRRRLYRPSSNRPPTPSPSFTSTPCADARAD